jgi:hypothetical protein
MEEGIEVISGKKRCKGINDNKRILVHKTTKHNRVDSLTILVQVKTN